MYGRAPFHFKPSFIQQQKPGTGFSQAIESSDLENLIQLLAQDGMLQRDGGGKVAALRHPITGRDTMVGLLLGIYRLARQIYASDCRSEQIASRLFWQQDRLIGNDLRLYRAAHPSHLYSH